MTLNQLQPPCLARIAATSAPVAGSAYGYEQLSNDDDAVIFCTELIN